MLLLLSKFKMLLLLLLILIIGCGAFFLGRMQGEAEEAAAPAIVQDTVQTQEASSTQKAAAKETAEEAIEKSKQKEAENMAKMEQALEERNERIEAENAKTTNHKLTPPKFKPSDVPTREPHFQN